MLSDLFKGVVGVTNTPSTDFFLYLTDPEYSSKSLISDPDYVTGLIVTSFLFRRITQIMRMIINKAPATAHPMMIGRLSPSGSSIDLPDPISEDFSKDAPDDYEFDYPESVLEFVFASVF